MGKPRKDKSMSGKNKKKKGSQCIREGKKYSQLKQSQKDKIMYWMVEETKEYYVKNYAFPEGCYVEVVLQRVYDRVQEDRIRISYKEIRKRYRKKQTRINERAKCDLNLEEQHPTEKAVFTNMCMVQDDCGRVVALDKVDGGYRGTTFPGGHLEEGETFCESVIREVREETGLEIRNPVFCGIYHWYKDGVHNVILLYRANEFSGELKSSEEGLVYWIPLADYRRKELAGGMDQVLKIVADGEAGECYMHLEGGKYQEYLFGKTAGAACRREKVAAGETTALYEEVAGETFAETVCRGRKDAVGEVQNDAMQINQHDNQHEIQVIYTHDWKSDHSLGGITETRERKFPQKETTETSEPNPLQKGIAQNSESGNLTKSVTEPSKRKPPYGGMQDAGRSNRPRKGIAENARTNHSQEETAEKILTFCEQARTRREIAAFCGYKDIRYVSEKYLNPLLRTGELEMTLPQTPRSKNQKYIRVVR